VSVVCPSVRLSACLFVCRVPQPNSRVERPRKPKIDRMEPHHRSNLSTYLEVKRSKLKVTRLINAHTVNAHYLPNGKAYELQTSYTEHKDPHHRHTPWLPTPRSKVKLARLRSPSDRVLAHKWRTKRHRNTEIGKKFAHPMYKKLYGRRRVRPTRYTSMLNE